MVRPAGVGALHHEPHLGPGPLPDQVVVHRAAQQQRRDGRERRVDRASRVGAAPVGQHHDPGACLDRGRHLGTDLGQPLAQRRAAAGHPVPAVGHVGGEAGQVAVVVDTDDLGEVVVADHRVGQHDLAARGGAGSSRFCSAPVEVSREVTSSSLIASSGGLVTWANSCAK